MKAQKYSGFAKHDQCLLSARANVAPRDSYPRFRPITATEVLACLQAPALPVAPGTPEAAQAHCGFLLPCLRVLAEQMQACSQRVSALLHTLAQEPGEGEGPSDVAIVQSLPGVGRKITVWLFAEAAQA